MTVKVTKVTVEGEKNGKSFAVEFSPARIGSIVLRGEDLRRALKGTNGSPKHKRFDPSQGFPKKVGTRPVVPPASAPTNDMTVVVDTVTDGTGFWWRDDDTWFHAE